MFRLIKKITFNGFPTLRQGSTGGYVRALQANLWSAGFQSTVGTIDGSFGSGTTSAARSYQSNAGLTADGVVGSGTWSNMSRYNINETANLFTFHHPGSTTYETNYYATETTMTYTLSYRTGGNISSGRVY